MGGDSRKMEHRGPPPNENQPEKKEFLVGGGEVVLMADGETFTRLALTSQGAQDGRGAGGDTEEQGAAISI